MTEDIRLSWFGKIGFTLLITLLILLLGATMGIIIGSKTRIKQLENRIAKLEKIDYRLTQIWEQVDSFDQFENRLDKLEVSLSKTQLLLKDRNPLPKKVTETAPSENINFVPVKIPPKIVQKQFHTVIPGDTLYSISHQYGMPVEKLRLLNKLTEASVIHPGQRLLVSL